MVKSANTLESFQWVPQPEAFRIILEIVRDFLEACPDANALAEKMRCETGTRFVDWIDSIRLNRSDGRLAKLQSAGYEILTDRFAYAVCRNKRGVFPAVLGWDGDFEIGIKVESAADFLAANHLQRAITGSPSSPFRICRAFAGKGCAMNVIERSGTLDFEARDLGSGAETLRLLHLEKLRARPRAFGRDEEGFEAADGLIEHAVRDLGRDLTCALWFAAEREFWMRRNRAAMVQKARQDRLGLGWANHDHHTYRSSRKNFRLLVATWEKLGFQCRERFYAGREAGWGAQVMEQPVAGLVTFNDVDLTPDELVGDFSHTGLQERKTLGTVGLWCGLHGDSFLQSGMHHLAGLFDFELLTKQLAEESGTRMMAPFSDFPCLRQAFTEGERWAVNRERVEGLLKSAAITDEQARQFLDKGAIGSHMENIERNDGFKGFNQAGVNEIINATDPRKNIGA